MTHPATHKRPTGRGCFSWARVVLDDGRVSWRLFRRAMDRRVRYEERNFYPNESREHIARKLNIARHQLRNTVDEIDMEIMGVTK